jgi:hypothetical protein
MAAKRGKSKKRSRGKEPRRPLKAFTLYLCENVDYDEIAEALDRHGVRYKRHRDHFPNQSGISDEILLRLVGEKGWILLTTDQRQRTREVEKLKIIQFNVRQFVFTSGNMSKNALIETLVKSKNSMRKFCSLNGGPFSASISKSGTVALRDLNVRAGKRSI